MISWVKHIFLVMASVVTLTVGGGTEAAPPVSASRAADYCGICLYD